LKTIFDVGFLKIQKSLDAIGIKRSRSFSWEALRAALKPHSVQKHIEENRKRFNVLISGRRFGKSRYSIRRIIQGAINYRGVYDPVSPPVIVIGMPTFGMVRRIHWRQLINLLRDCPLVENIDRTNLIIDFKGNRPSIMAMGLNDDDGDRARGLRLYGACIDEVQAIKSGIIETVILPALLDTPNSFLDCTGTPKGKANTAYHLYTKAQEDPELWSSFLYKTIDNPTLPAGVIDTLRKLLDERTFRQEAEASFEEFLGQIFYTFDLDKHVKHEILFPKWDMKFLGVDWGDRHPAYSVIGVKAQPDAKLFQFQYGVLETWVSDGKSLVPDSDFDHRLQEVCDRFDIFRAFCDPAEPSSIIRLRQYPQLGLKRSIRGFNRIEEGLKILNSLLHNDLLLFKKGLPVIDKLLSYSRDVDALGGIMPTISKGQDDHEIDTIRYVAATLEYKTFLVNQSL